MKKVHGKCEKSSLVTSEKSSHTKNNIKNTTLNTNINTAKNEQDLECAFNEFWEAGMLKVNKSRAVKSFNTAYKKHIKQNPCTPHQFAQMLIADIQRRLAVGQFGFDKTHPASYLNNARWEDEYKQQNIHSPSNAYQDDGSWAKNSVIIQDANGMVRVVDRNCEVEL